MVGFLASALLSLPLFYLALDWGRWVQIHFILSMIVISTLLPRSTGDVEFQRPLTLGRLTLYSLLILSNILLHVKHSYQGIRLNKIFVHAIKRYLSPNDSQKDP